MKYIKILGILMLLALTQKTFSQTTYKYYVALKNYTNVPNNFSKSDLLNYINGIYLGTALYNDINSNASIVKKSIPNAKTPILKKCITIKSTNPNLVSTLNANPAYFEYAFLIPPTHLAYTSNDYYGCGSRTDQGLINGVQTTKTTITCINTQLDLVRAKEAWDISVGHPKIKIGISDDNLSRFEEDLVNVLDTFYLIDGSSGHGTAVAGTAIAHTNNGKGLASLAGNKCKYVFNSWNEDIAGMVVMSQRKGVRVVNASWGWRGSTSFPFLPNVMVNEIVDSNRVVFVSAAGNGICWGSTYCENTCLCSDTTWVYPAAFDKALCVTSIGHMEAPGSPGRYARDLNEFSWIDVHRNRTSHPNSNFSHHHNSRVDVFAPGYLTTTLSIGNTYGLTSGTSFASPMVSSLCALVASVNPCLSAIEIMNIVKNTANASIYNISFNQPYLNQLGTGRIDAYQAVNAALISGTVFQQNRPATGTGKYSTGITNLWGNTRIVAGSNVTTGTTGNVIIPNGSNVKYEANISVDIHNGFEVRDGANFEIVIKDSPCY